jgi:hypothetical protein
MRETREHRRRERRRAEHALESEMPPNRGFERCLAARASPRGPSSLRARAPSAISRFIVSLFVSAITAAASRDVAEIERLVFGRVAREQLIMARARMRDRFGFRLGFDRRRPRGA